MQDKQALDLIAEILRSPRSNSTIEYIATIASKVRDTESLNRFDVAGNERKPNGPVSLCEGVDWPSH